MYVAEDYIASIHIDMSGNITIAAGTKAVIVLYRMNKAHLTWLRSNKKLQIFLKIMVVVLKSMLEQLQTTEISYVENRNDKIKSFGIKAIGRIVCKDDETDKTEKLRTSFQGDSLYSGRLV